MNLSELIADRDRVAQEARNILDDMADAPAPKRVKLEAEHDKLLSDFDTLSKQISRHTRQASAEARSSDAHAGLAASQERHASKRPINDDGEEQFGQDDGDDFSRIWGRQKRSGWVDTNGNAVRVLRNNQSLATSRSPGVAMGDAVRALITGPRNDAEKRALSEGTSSAGGYTVPTPLASWFIDRLRNQSVVVRAGAMTVPMSSQTLAIARLETDPAIGWRAENAALTEGDPTFGRVLLTAKSLAGIVKISRELLADTVNAGAMIEEALAKAMALEIDRAAIYGTGANDSPTGVVNTSSINSVSMGANGATIATGGYDKMLDAVYEMMLDNAADPTAMVMHPRTAIAIDKLKDSNDNPQAVPERIKRIPSLVTTAAPINETQGTANNASSIVFGDFTQLFLGVREDINITVLDQLYAGTGQIALAVHARVDVQLAHKESFCKLTGIIS